MKRALMCVVSLCALLTGCAPETKGSTPRDADLLSSIRKDQAQWREALKAYSICTQAYDETVIRTSQPADVIADAAATACHPQLSRWAAFKNQERAHIALLNRGAATDTDPKDAQTDEQIAVEFIARTRPAQIDYIQQLRDAAGGHR